MTIYRMPCKPFIIIENFEYIPHFTPIIDLRGKRNPRIQQSLLKEREIPKITSN